jgi:hypothetical protein
MRELVVRRSLPNLDPPSPICDVSETPAQPVRPESPKRHRNEPVDPSRDQKHSFHARTFFIHSL